MSCPFSLLGLPRRPLLTQEEIGNAYRQFAGTLHPDQVGGDAEKFRELNEAQVVLLDPARRLRELVGSASNNQLPPAAAELFPQIASLLHQADDLIEKYSRASNALSKALLTTPLKMLMRDLMALLTSVRAWRAFLDQELGGLDEVWPVVESTKLSQLSDSFSYAARWERELRERELALEAIMG